MPSWNLLDHGREFVLHDGGQGRVRLSLDGADVGEVTVARLTPHEFALEPFDGKPQKVIVELGTRKRLKKVELVEAGGGVLPVVVPFVPPPGSRQRRLYDLREAHPYAYAARHIVTSGAGLLGLGALVSAFLARFAPDLDWSWVPNPEIDLPDWNLFGWVPDLFAWWPDWDLGWLKIVLGIAVAISLTASEIDRRKKQRLRREAQRPPRDS